MRRALAWGLLLCFVMQSTGANALAQSNGGVPTLSIGAFIAPLLAALDMGGSSTRRNPPPGWGAPVTPAPARPRIHPLVGARQLRIGEPLAGPHMRAYPLDPATAPKDPHAMRAQSTRSTACKSANGLCPQA